MRSFLHKTPKNRSAMAWVLIVAFLLQPILSYLVTPMPMKSDKGFHTVICTLKGIKEVYIDYPSISGESNVQDLEECPAIKLFEIAGTVQPAAFFEPPIVQLYAVGLVDQTANYSHRRLHFSAYSSRAPPLV